MQITNEEELAGIQAISKAVADTLKAMADYAKEGVSTKELDDFGGEFLSNLGAKSAPKLTYDFPGWTCISINNEVAHGIPSEKTILKNGDLINIDVSAELNGYWADNGCSFVIGEDVNNHAKLIETSKNILKKAISRIKGGVKINEIGKFIETEAKRNGFKVIKNLTGHGVGRSLHEEPHEVANFYDKYNQTRFRKNSVVAVETFIATHSTFADTLSDGWTLVGNNGGFVAQHEHTILITDGEPKILTTGNGVWD